MENFKLETPPELEKWVQQLEKHFLKLVNKSKEGSIDDVKTTKFVKNKKEAKKRVVDSNSSSSSGEDHKKPKKHVVDSSSDDD